jgi:hypothetical protein
MPHSAPPQLSISIWADLSSTIQTPLGSAAAAGRHAKIKLHATRIGKRISSPLSPGLAFQFALRCGRMMQQARQDGGALPRPRGARIRRKDGRKD